MSVTFEIPSILEQQLRRELKDLDQLAKEAALVELYRQAKITHHELATALGLDRFATEGLLKRYHVTDDLMTVDEFDSQTVAAEKILSQGK
jgi:hypothetical protein